MKLLSSLVLCFFFALASQAQTPTKEKKLMYSYQLSKVSTEAELQNLTAKISEYKNIFDCKYHYKAAEGKAEIVFSTIEKPLRSEHDKSNDLPNVKTLIMQNGLLYEGVNILEINPEN